MPGADDCCGNSTKYCAARKYRGAFFCSEKSVSTIMKVKILITSVVPFDSVEKLTQKVPLSTQSPSTDAVGHIGVDTEWREDAKM